MKRTTKPKKKMIIKRKKFKIPKWEQEVMKKIPVDNLGGFLPNPPEDCNKKNQFQYQKTIPWIDLSCCHNCSRKPCEERRLYLKYLKVTRNRKIQGEKYDSTDSKGS